MAEKLQEILAPKEVGVIPAIEKFFDSMGMMQGTFAPVYRAGFGAAVGYIIGEAARPFWSHTASGQKRPWAFTAGESSSATLIPWWALPVGGAIVCGVLI